jgi:hypothetical protein
MAIDVLVLLFPVVLAIHTLDEMRSQDAFVHAYRSRLPARLQARPVMLWAATWLTAAAAVICIGAVTRQSPGLLLMSKVAICALLLNAVGHCARSPGRRQWLPGTRSASLTVNAGGCSPST